MASAAAELQAMHYRRPWYWLLVLAVAAFAATLVVAWNARSRITLNTSQFESMQTLRLEKIERRIDEYFQDAEQVAILGSQTLGSVRGDKALLRSLTLETFRNHRDPALYGLGVFYAPHVFDRHIDLIDDYAHSGSKRFTPFDRFLTGGIVEVFFVGTESDVANSYVKDRWYNEAIAARGHIDYEGPYGYEGRSFISVMKAFYQDGRLAGVMSVDTLTPWFQTMMRTALSEGDIAWIEEPGSGRFLLGTSVLPRDLSSRVDRSEPLHFSKAIVHLSSDASGLYASNRRNVWAAVVLSLAIWILAAVVARLLLSRWGAQEQTLALQLEQARLEGEIALGKTVAMELRKAAYTDALTGLPNRAAFVELASDLLGSADEEVSHAVLFVDLDRFNVVNETLGHAAGDELLRVIAARLAGFVADDDMVATLGADEFVIVARVDDGSVRVKADRALALIAQPVVLFGRTIHPHASIGIAMVDRTYAKGDDLLRDAGIAVNEAKRRGRARFVIFDAAMRAQAAEEAELETSLRRAIERRELVPHYQPIVNVATGRIASFEALVRWVRPGQGIVSAARFMPFAESHALVHEIDSLVLPQVARHCAALFGLFPEATVAVNLSAAELSDPALGGRIETLLAQQKVAPERLKLEITETSMMTPSDEAAANLAHLRGIGVQLVLDDFGTGYSSLAYLQRLPVVGLKIDRSFVEHIAEDRRHAELVRNVVALAHTFSLYTVAEGVESAEQLQVLADIGVGFAQGYLYSPAVDIGSIAMLSVKDYPTSVTRA